MDKAFRLDEVDAREKVLEAKAERASSVAMIVPAYNERGKVERVVASTPRDLVDAVLVMDDGSDDGSMDLVRREGGTVCSVAERQGIGAAIRRGLARAGDDGHDVAVVIAGNGKDDPRQVHRLLWPILIEGFDYVQGSRYLPGGIFGQMPLHRKLVTRVYPYLVALTTRRRVTDGTNGYRAYRLDVLDRCGADLDQDWLSECLEYYIAMKVYRSRLRVAEVPVAKLYPRGAGHAGYTKVRTSKLHHRLKPLAYLTLGIKR